MKTQKAILLSLFISISTIGQSQISKTINCTAGNLDALLGGSKTVVTNLTITGSIDARDFKTMSYIMTNLLDLDISAVTIKSYTGSGGTDVNYNTVYPANEIPIYAFQTNSPSILRSIILPNSLTSIGKNAFWSHNELLSIIIPSSVISIGQEAFSGTNISSINLPNGLVKIGWGAFFNTNIDQIVIPNTVISLNENFGFDYGYRSGVFSNCAKLASVTLPSSLVDIPEKTFSKSTKLKNVTIPSSISYIGEDAFESCSSISEITIPNSVKKIDFRAFSKCTGLKTVIIGSNVSIISDLAFDGCTSLSSITVRNRKPIDLTISPNIFRGVDKTNCILYVPLGTKADYQTNVVWMDFKNIVESTTDISSPTTTSINIFPNPTAESFVLNGLEEEANVQVIDLNGKILLTQKVDNTKKVFVNTLRNGVYIVKIITAQQAIEQKIIKY